MAVWAGWGTGTRLTLLLSRTVVGEASLEDTVAVDLGASLISSSSVSAYLFPCLSKYEVFFNTDSPAVEVCCSSHFIHIIHLLNLNRSKVFSVLRDIVICY